ncbi:hypothetical protein BRARA_I04309 [Brassica rapa]|uniref:WRKY domain-containing protein n=2 Tax=Brassica TaxID=3705 RepID=A0ABQ8C683_BRANA|nr:WRKY transcription factor 68 [Brassica napus]KAH0912586.1 hypothetical protein HID58_035907 [Brassica napus]RID47737.1 hypothetical protein BRARA_I04309 [Brassica rapa]
MEKTGAGMTFSELGQRRDDPSSLSDSSWERYPVGFMELLGVHHQDSSRYALTNMPPMQLTATSNPSSSISYALCEAVTGKENNRYYQKHENDDEEQKHKRNKRFKSTKSSEQTKMKAPRVSFITKSQVNNLDDGYKWRKYGQKPVRNSPFPRSYYRCTISCCNVKKRVERSFTDQSSVITTYEGQHTHPRPLILSRQGSFGSDGSASEAYFDLTPTLPPQLHQLFDYNNHHQQQNQELSPFGTEYLSRQEKEFNHDGGDHYHVIKPRRTQDLLDGAGLVKDNGLLQDVVPAHIINEEY